MEHKTRWFTKKLNASLHAPELRAIVDESGKVTAEYIMAPLANYRESGAPWGLIGKTVEELQRDGFTEITAHMKYT